MKRESISSAVSYCWLNESNHGRSLLISDASKPFSSTDPIALLNPISPVLTCANCLIAVDSGKGQGQGTGISRTGSEFLWVRGLVF